MAYVYQHVRLDTNEVFYIGVGKENKRASEKRGRNKHWHHIVNKVGYSIEIIAEGITWEEACQKEKELIGHYGRKDLGLGPLVNMTDGGEGVPGVKRPPFSKEHRQKISEYRKSIKGQKRKPISEEHKQKISVAQIGKKKPHSEETKLKMSITRTGIPRNKISCPYCGKIGGDNIIKRWHFDRCKNKIITN